MKTKFLALSFAFAPLFNIPASAQTEVEALLYSTMPSASIHRPQMAMDGDEKTYFKSYYGMGGKDDFQILLSRPIPLRSLRIVTGDNEKQNLLTNGAVETSGDGTTFKRAASFNKAGIAEAALNEEPVMSLRIRLAGRRGIPSLLLREITLDSPTKIGRVLIGPGRGFADLSQAPDLADWSRRAEKQVQEFWPDAAALLYSDGFIPPNKINMVYRTGPGVTGVAAVSGGEMEINSEWCRKQPNDTGLTVHEMAHVVQAMSAYNPVWLIEGIADYVRWVKFEPQNHRPRLNPQTASYRDSYRTTATFLAWCELNYDSRLVTKLNHDVRFGNYKEELWKKYCGKDINALWAEFIEAYKKDPAGVITPPIALADRPRTLPVVTEGNGVLVDLKNAFNGRGIVKDGAPFPANSGFDEGGAAFSSQLLGTTLTWKNVPFNIGAPDANNLISARGQSIALPEGKYASLWFLGSGVGGSQKGQEFLVTYSDGSTQTLAQNLSDWYLPQDFPGESRAVKMDYRNMSNGARDPRSFYAYSYGFALDAGKTVQSLKLPNNPAVKILAVSLAK